MNPRLNPRYPSSRPPPLPERLRRSKLRDLRKKELVLLVRSIRPRKKRPRRRGSSMKKESREKSKRLLRRRRLKENNKSLSEEREKPTPSKLLLNKLRMPDKRL